MSLIDIFFLVVNNHHISGAHSLRVEFDPQCSTERRHDPLTLYDTNNKLIATLSGREAQDWATEVRVIGLFICYSYIIL